MLVGPSGAGKSSSWRCLLEALDISEPGSRSDYYVIDPKAIGKESIYGKLDSTTLEWTDGIFTTIVRSVLRNTRGELRSNRRHWIVFDGDVDPDWAENLNSVLDDNGLLTLPSGERLRIPDNMRILIEVDTLNHTTMATISRCGMIWYSTECVTDGMILRHVLHSLLPPSTAREALLCGRGAIGVEKKRTERIGSIGKQNGDEPSEIYYNLPGGAGHHDANLSSEAAQEEYLRVLRPLFLGRRSHVKVDREMTK